LIFWELVIKHVRNSVIFGRNCKPDDYQEHINTNDIRMFSTSGKITKFVFDYFKKTNIGMC